MPAIASLVFYWVYFRDNGDHFLDIAFLLFLKRTFDWLV